MTGFHGSVANSFSIRWKKVECGTMYVDGTGIAREMVWEILESNTAGAFAIPVPEPQGTRV